MIAFVERLWLTVLEGHREANAAGMRPFTAG